MDLYKGNMPTFVAEGHCRQRVWSRRLRPSRSAGTRAPERHPKAHRNSRFLTNLDSRQSCTWIFEHSPLSIVRDVHVDRMTWYRLSSEFKSCSPACVGTSSSDGKHASHFSCASQVGTDSNDGKQLSVCLPLVLEPRRNWFK